jgi:HSP20 family protein
MKRRKNLLLDEIERLFEGAMPSGRWVSIRGGKTWRPPTDVYETDAYVVVKVEIAGMEMEDFYISFSDRILTIEGVRRDPVAKLAYQQMEISYGDFRTEIHLPWAIEEEEIEATYKDGFLKVILPKVRAQKVRIASIKEKSRIR